ncbi:hypothetical protein [Brochothrix campestris]|uniref:Uncharacterized protein n=1 Tax=Brochothrix campestris FSL F6-1037 TaxID=1265861 RepID=W7CM58_9LIST|nr:hypothetical protein [Brochothrix campestris]EUJ34203.1 hypothetical protein BCAMP_12628 [Brochothrix campestris FSL F6-1037]
MKLSKKTGTTHTKFTKSKQYMLTLFIFFCVLMVIIISPKLMGKNYDYDTITLNEDETLGADFSAQVTNITYNPSKKIMKLAFKYNDQNVINRLSNLKISYDFKFINNQEAVDSRKNSKEIKVSDDYIVVFVKNVPEDFGVMSSTIQPRLTHAKAEEKQEFKEAEWKFYVSQDDVKIDNALKIVTKSELINEGVQQEINDVEKEIKNVKSQIKEMKVEMSLTEKEIESKEKDLDYQTLEEKQETTSDINSLKGNTLSSKSKITELNEKIEKYQQKIKLLQTKMVK